MSATLPAVLDAAKELLAVIDEGPEPPSKTQQLNPYRDWTANVELAAERLRDALLHHELVDHARERAT